MDTDEERRKKHQEKENNGRTPTPQTPLGKAVDAVDAASVRGGVTWRSYMNESPTAILD